VFWEQGSGSDHVDDLPRVLVPSNRPGVINDSRPQNDGNWDVRVIGSSESYELLEIALDNSELLPEKIMRDNGRVPSNAEIPT